MQRPERSATAADVSRRIELRSRRRTEITVEEVVSSPPSTAPSWLRFVHGAGVGAVTVQEAAATAWPALVRGQIDIFAGSPAAV